MIQPLVPKNREFHFKDDEPMGLAVGQNEEKRKILASERQAEYNKFLIEKENRLRNRASKVEPVKQSSPVASLNYKNTVQKLKEEEEQYRNSPHDDTQSIVELLQIQIANNRRLVTKLAHYKDLNRQYRDIFQALKTSTSTESDPGYNSLDEVKTATSTHQKSSNSLPSTSNMRRSVGRHHPSDSTIGQSIFGIIPLQDQSMNKKETYAEDFARQMQEDRIRKDLKSREEESKKSPCRHKHVPFNNGCRKSSLKDSDGNIINADRIAIGPYAMCNNGLDSMQKKDDRYKRENYRKELEEQINERNRLAKKQAEIERMEEELLAQRIEEQRLRMEKEYQEEKAKRLRKEEQERLKRERLAELQEARTKEEERRRKEEAEQRQKKREQFVQAENPVVDYPPKPASPPVPSIRTQATLTKAPEKLPRQTSTPDPNRHISDQLAKIRKDMSLQQREYDSVMQNEKKTYKIMNRRAVQDDSDDDEDNAEYDYKG